MENYSRETCRLLFANFKATNRPINNNRDLSKNDMATTVLKSKGLNIDFSIFQISLTFLINLGKMISNEISRQT